MNRKLLDFIRMPHVVGSRTKALLTAYFLLGLGLLFVGSIVFAGRTARRMDRQAAALTRIFSQFISETAFSANHPGAEEIIRTVLREASFPIIIADVNGVPIIWDGVGVPPPVGDDPGELAGTDLDDAARARRDRLTALMQEFDAQNPPHPVTVEGVVQAYVHYGASNLSRRLRWMPHVLVLALAIFLAVGLFGFRYMKLGEQRSIWVGMARETAHQLGTPLTSLLGWVQLLEAQEDSDLPPDEARARRARTVSEMQRDLERLSKVSARFSKIGSQPDLVSLDVGAVLRDTIEYMERRIPHLGGSVRITQELDAVPPIRANRELLEWALENLMKNALDALDSGGEIRVQARHLASEAALEVRVADTGKGIPPAMRNRVWEPGYTTKRRGWGLGLALVRRIVEDYHGGRIWIEDNPDRRGVCFAIRLPVAV